MFNNQGLDKVDIVFAKCGAGCGWTARVPLPRLRKTLIYLDTSVVSHIARADRRGAPANDPWTRLLRSLEAASDAEVIECPLSPFVDEEVMLGPDGRQHAWQARWLSIGNLVEPEVVWGRQLLREWQSVLRSEEGPPVVESDAFSGPPHRWQESMAIKIGPMSSRWLRRQSRKAKQGSHSTYERFAEHYREARCTFGEILHRESIGYSNYIAGRQDFVGPLIIAAMRCTDCTGEHAADRLREFLVGERFRNLPFVKIHATLLATVLVGAGQEKHARRIRESDPFDIDQAATFLPYFDVFVADTFFATAIREHGLHEEFGTQVLGTGQVDELITLIDKAVADAPHAGLVARVRAATTPR